MKKGSHAIHWPYVPKKKLKKIFLMHILWDREKYEMKNEKYLKTLTIPRHCVNIYNF